LQVARNRPATVLRGLIAKAADPLKAGKPTEGGERKSRKAMTQAAGQRERDGGDEIAGVARPSFSEQVGARLPAFSGHCGRALRAIRELFTFLFLQMENKNPPYPLFQRGIKC